MITRFGLFITILFVCSAAWAQTIFKDPFEIPQPIELRVVITPGAKLFTRSGEVAQLTAEVLNQDGIAVSVPVTWHSSDGSIVAVNDGGLITSISELGSAQISAEAPGATPDLIVVTVADPVDGAILVADDRVVGVPDPIDPDAPFGLLYQYTATLTDMPPLETGDILIASEAAPIAGRVVSVTPQGDQTEVTLEVAPMNELFDQLVLRETIPLSALPIDIQPELADLFSETRLSDGALVLSPQSLNKGPQGTSISQFLECETSLTNWQNVLTVSTGTDIIIDPTINFEIDYDVQTGLQRFVSSGSLNAVLELKPRTQAAFQAKITCKFQVGRIQIPLAGPFSWIFSGQVPLGVGIEVDGKVSTTAQAGYDLTAVGNANFTAGIVCEPDCDVLADLSVGVDGTGRPVLPTLDAILGGFQLDLGGFLFAYADLAFGNPLITALQFNTLGVKAGIKQSASFRSIQSQISDAAYASEFKLELSGSAGAGNGIQSFLAMLNITTGPLELFNVKTLLAQSPKGTLSITPSSVAPGDDSQVGDSAQFSVRLNPTTYLGAYVVESVQIYWLRSNAQGGDNLELSRPGCNTLVAATNQTEFTCQTDFLQEHIGQQRFYALVKASLFGVALPFLLEVNPNSMSTLTVASPNEAEYFYGVEAQAYDTGEEIVSLSQMGPVCVEAQDGNVRASATATYTKLQVSASAPDTDVRYEEGISDAGIGGFELEPILQPSVTFILNGSFTAPGGPADNAYGCITVEINDGQPQRSTVIGSACRCNSSQTDCVDGYLGEGVLDGYQGGQIEIELVNDLPPSQPFNAFGASLRAQATDGATADFELMIPAQLVQPVPIEPVECSLSRAKP